MGPFEIMAVSFIGSLGGTIIAVMLISQFRFNNRIDDMFEDL